MKLWKAALLAACLQATLASSASAEDDGGLPSVTHSLVVPLGTTVRMPVGYARGLMCDDLSIIDVELQGGQKDNVLVVKGLKLGSTVCRAGLDRGGAYVIVGIRVVPPPPKAEPRDDADAGSPPDESARPTDSD